MHTRRMRARVPSATPIAKGYVPGRRFALHKRSEDGSAKADALFTGRVSDRVWGIVYQLDAAEKPILDEHEFLGVGYDEHVVDVVAEQEELSAGMYVARAEAIDGSLLCYSWYKELVVHGAREHSLPADYIAQLQNFASTLDPDAARHALHRELLIGRSPTP